ncbi:uncharacterized protein IWZ02DRAFT_410415, partial [Phyllosticta citriasiana]|uniref:uncharacterized protein n=1 Tax=Phyllosticta citriasiana TaxID=595635 RepID=UPI0030FDC001
ISHLLFLLLVYTPLPRESVFNWPPLYRPFSHIHNNKANTQDPLPGRARRRSLLHEAEAAKPKPASLSCCEFPTPTHFC